MVYSVKCKILILLWILYSQSQIWPPLRKQHREYRLTLSLANFAPKSDTFTLTCVGWNKKIWKESFSPNTLKHSVLLPSLTFGCTWTQHRTVSGMYFGSTLCLLNVPKMQHSGKNTYDFRQLRSGSFFLWAVAVLNNIFCTKSATLELKKVQFSAALKVRGNSGRMRFNFCH